MSKHDSILVEVKGSDTLVQIARSRIEDHASVGYVIDVSDKLVLLHQVSDRIDLDGFEILRIRDITTVETDFHRREFLERALDLKSQSAHDPGRR
jgi:hypothetical protein